LRPIRSFVRREGRITAGQQRALAELWPRYGIVDTRRIDDLRALFGRDAPRWLEVGCGDGTCLALLAERNPDCDFVGVEVYRPGLGKLLNRVAQKSLGNVRVAAGDAMDILPGFSTGAFDGVYVLFPDPWPKKRHHKRRLVQAPFVAAVRRVMRRGARLYLATDAQDYAEHMRITLAQSGLFYDAGDAGWLPRPRSRPLTRYEARAIHDGRAVHELVFIAA
jgi:tRNA (guanine-N7-)-methyltransferase